MARVEATTPRTLLGAGALATTTTDLDRFHAALADGTRLAKRQLHAMRRPLPQSGEGQYGLGYYRLPDPRDDDGSTYGTLTVSYSTPDGATRVTASMTGRSLEDRKAEDVQALFGYADSAFAARCGASAAPDAAVDQLVERAAATYAR